MLKWLAGASMLAMMLLVCANVIIRFFGKPIEGTYELVQIFLLILVSFSLADGQFSESHTAVDLLTRRLSDWAQGILGIITNLVSMGLFGLLAWRCILLASKFQRIQELSMTLRIPLFPFLYVVAFNCIVACLVLFTIQLPKEFSKGFRK